MVAEEVLEAVQVLEDKAGMEEALIHGVQKKTVIQNIMKIRLGKVDARGSLANLVSKAVLEQVERMEITIFRWMVADMHLSTI